MPFEYVHNAAFEDPEFARTVKKPLPGTLTATKMVANYSYCSGILPNTLTHEQERFLFMRLNYYKFLYNRLEEEKLREIEQNKEAVIAINARYRHRLSDYKCRILDTRNLLIQANVKLIIRTVNRIVRNSSLAPNMISDGTLVCMRSIELFDTTRNVRFSSYLVNALYRVIPYNVTRDRILPNCNPVGLHEDTKVTPPDYGVDTEKVEKTLDALLKALKKRKGDRLHSIVLDWMGIGTPQMTKVAMMKKYGISKTRVVQLQNDALSFLKEAGAYHSKVFE